MVIPRKKKTAWSLAMAVCLGILALSLFHCKNTTTPEETQPYITVRNDCGIELDIFMDGTFQFFLKNREYYFIENVTPGTHLLEAKRRETDILVKSHTAEISADFNYTWTISSEAQIGIKNEYGETLDIYGDGQFQDTLDDQEGTIFRTVPYGSHLLEAKKAGGTTVVASTTIDIYEDIYYNWTIKK